MNEPLIPGKKLSSVQVSVGQYIKADSFYHVKRFKVTGVYPFIVTCMDIDTGLMHSFPKADFITGAVRICQ